MQEKIVELETKYSFQEDLLQQLNDEVIRQQRQLEQVIGEMKELRGQLSDLMAREGGSGIQSESSEKPPHY